MKSEQDVLDRYPIVSPESMPETRAVLLEIPGDLRLLQEEDPACLGPDLAHEYPDCI